MTNGTFKKILDFRIKKIRETLDKKAEEYSRGDRLYNFKRAGEIMRTDPENSLMGMFMKHLVSVIDIVETGDYTNDLLNEKIGDAINYLILLEAILKEGKK